MNQSQIKPFLLIGLITCLISVVLIAFYLGRGLSSPSIPPPKPPPEASKYVEKPDEKEITWYISSPWSDYTKILKQEVKALAQEITKATRATETKIIVKYREATDIPTFNNDKKNLLSAVQRGKEIQMLHSAAYYWSNQIKGSAFFSAIPFGKDYDKMEYWIKHEDGLTLWQDLYADYNIIPFACGHTDQQAGGWFKKSITSLSDFKGLKMRIPGLGGQVLSSLGTTTNALAPGKIPSFLSGGGDDIAAEWIGPYDDFNLELHNYANFYYLDGWQEPNTMFELIINKDAYESIPSDVRGIIENVIDRYNQKIHNRYVNENRKALEKIQDTGVTIISKQFPFTKTLKQKSEEVVRGYVEDDEMSIKIYESYYDEKYK